MSVEQAALMSEIFPLPSARWEDLCALSHAAVKDSCHPVSGSNTHTVNEKSAVSRRDAEISGNPPPLHTHTLQDSKQGRREEICLFLEGEKESEKEKTEDLDE